jgi:hypothetical protein
MARHAFSRRSHRRRRTGGLRGSRFSTGPFAEFGDGWMRIKPRYQKIIGKKILRVSSGRRIGQFRLQDPEPCMTAHFYEERPDAYTELREAIAHRMRTLDLAEASVDHAAEHGP